MTTDTPQFRGGNPYFFRENPYQSVSFIYVSMQQRTKIGALARSHGATVGLGLRL